jgi:predicted unusual protein kinase regulating ubiquinone biosynthesis (AarF/ABC1/UbiB family)
MAPTSPPAPSKGRAVPSGRFSRLASFGSMASGVAGGMLVDGARQLATGKRPTMGDLLLTPANALKVTQQLAHLRGAAMKLGQLMSMDGGEILPPEMTEVLARLRSDAEHMPQAQLHAALQLRWGKHWKERFSTFSEQPIAAASIGQVHRATTRDGRELAIKIQYPGVSHSIDSDINNVASLLRLSGILPKTLDIAPMLSEAKRQLHEEADYTREGACLERFAALLKGSPDYVVPAFHADLSTPNMLAMSYVDGVPVDSMAGAPQEERNRIVRLLIELVLRELFEFKLMQTDPNFANYQYDPASKKLILLDFGATRSFTDESVASYHRLMKAGLDVDTQAARQAAMDIGFFDAATEPKHQTAVMEMFDMAMEPLRQDGPFDFGAPDVIARLRDAGMALTQERDFWHIPPMDTLFLQRKVGGIYLLASKLGAKINVRDLLTRHL